MMARGVSDPYCRFITPSELNGMRKYDVTGIGLNLGTPQEYTRKTVRVRGGNTSFIINIQHTVHSILCTSVFPAYLPLLVV